MIDKYERFLKQIIVKAGNEVMKYYKKIGIKYTKRDPSDVVTEADLKSHDLIVQAIKKNFPDHKILSEEDKEHNLSSGYLWIVDPLDGTRNFLTKTENFGVMIALAKNKKVILGALYIPVHRALYFASSGKGAYLNNKRINCSQTKDFDHSYGCSAAIISQQALFLEGLSKISNKPWVNNHGSTIGNTTLVADGRRDWYFTAGGSEIWDNAATYIVMKEAGCKITNIDGKEWQLEDRQMVVANPFIHDKLLSATKILRSK